MLLLLLVVTVVFLCAKPLALYMGVRVGVCCLYGKYM